MSTKLRNAVWRGGNTHKSESTVRVKGPRETTLTSHESQLVWTSDEPNQEPERDEHREHSTGWIMESKNGTYSAVNSAMQIASTTVKKAGVEESLAEWKAGNVSATNDTVDTPMPTMTVIAITFACVAQQG